MATTDSLCSDVNFYSNFPKYCSNVVDLPIVDYRWNGSNLRFRSTAIIIQPFEIDDSGI